MTYHVYEVSAPFVTPEIALRRYDLIVWSPREIFAWQKRQGRITEVSLPPHFGAQILGNMENLTYLEASPQSRALDLAVGDDVPAATPAPRGLSTHPRHLAIVR